MKLDLRNTRGAVLRQIDVRDDVFGVPMNTALVHQVVVGQLANARQGTSKAKTRAEVAGGGIKPRPQKYTGRARQGSIRAPQWKGGGIVFGPSPRSYSQKTPRRMKRRSLVMALSDKARENQLVVLEDLSLESAKTKEMLKVFETLGVATPALLVADGAHHEVLRSTRNIPGIRMLPAALLNTVDLLNARNVVITLDAVRKAEALWGGPFVRRKAEAAAASDGGSDEEANNDENGEE